MSIKIGTSDVTDIKIGTTNVNTVYIGNTVIWQRGGDVYTYEIHTTVEHSSGGTINAAGSNYATIKTYWRTYINSVLDSEVLTDMSVSITYNPETDHFSVTRTGVGTYKVEADSRGTDAGDSWSCTVGISYSGENTSESVYQEANAVIDTEYDTSAVFVINSSYTNEAYPAPASGDGWIVTATATIRNYENYQYTSLDWTGFVQVGNDTLVPQSEIGISVSGGLYDGGGSGSGANISWPSMGTTEYEDGRSGIITATYSSYSDGIAVYQEANVFVSNSNYYISKYLIDGVASNYNASYSSGSVSVYGECTYTSTYTSGSYSVTEALSASDISFSGAGFSYSNFWISYTLNDTGSTRNCTVYYSHSGATTVSRSISQASVVLPTVITNLAQVSGYGTSATIALSGQVTSWGSGSASSYGIRYKLSSSGTWNNVPCSNISSGVFSVSPDLTGLSVGTYDYQAYATSSVGVTGYGDSNQFTVASAPSYYISVSPSGYLHNQGGNVQVTVTSSHGWNATVNKGDFFSLSISASSGVSGDTPTISIIAPVADGTYNGNVTFTCGTATHVFYISVTIGLL